MAPVGHLGYQLQDHAINCSTAFCYCFGLALKAVGHRRTFSPPPLSPRRERSVYPAYGLASSGHSPHHFHGQTVLIHDPWIVLHFERRRTAEGVWHVDWPRARLTAPGDKRSVCSRLVSRREGRMREEFNMAVCVCTVSSNDKLQIW